MSIAIIVIMTIAVALILLGASIVAVVAAAGLALGWGLVYHVLTGDGDKPRTF